jgi:4-hydroxythreonine-4-phosphate dehydrogenase
VTSAAPLLVITMGDPSGIGALVTVDALNKLPDLTRTHRLLVIGSLAELEAAADRLSIEWRPREISANDLDRIDLGCPFVVEPPPGPWSRFRPGAPSEEGGHFQINAVDMAVELARSGQASAVVTGPVSKVAITRAGVDFGGHTEHLARACGLGPEDVTMLFAGRALNIALVTTHYPLAQVSAVLTVERVASTILRVLRALRGWWRVERPRVAVLGLNPHAGEEGLFGREEIEVIEPAIELARRRDAGAAALIEGPIPSEAGLRRTVAGEFDCAIAHYHDQATIPSKLLDMGRAVNVTLGLPFLRVSVDHGVAYDAARAGEASSGSMVAALELAARLT